MARKSIDVNDIILSLEQLGQQLSDEERDEIILWTKGRALAHVVNTDGWDVVREMLGAYVTGTVDEFLKVKPGENDRVLASHAVAYAANEICNKFLEDVQAAINASRTMPGVLRAQAKNIKTETPSQDLHQQ